MTLIVGLTGGIGSGKSTVAKIFDQIGIPIYQSDIAAKNLMNQNLQLKQSIIDLFGAESYVDGILNRRYIANIVFNNPDILTKLNQLVHPLVFEDFDNWYQKIATNVPYIIKEAALLIETKVHQKLDYLIVVTAPKQLKIERVMTRDKITEAQVLERMKNQQTESYYREHASFLIHNYPPFKIIDQVMYIHKQLLELTR